MNAYQNEPDEQKIIEMLDEHGEVEIAGLTFMPSDIVKELDPTAFRCMLADLPEEWECGECGNQYDDQEEADECCQETI